MNSLKELMEEYKEKPFEYNGKKFCMFDKFPVQNGDTLIISIEDTNSTSCQGCAISAEGYFEMLGKKTKAKGKITTVRLWEDSQGYDPKNIELKVVTKKSSVTIYNVWESHSLSGHPSVEDSSHYASMIVEDIEGGRRYRCNTGQFDEDFDDIIFTVKIKK